MHMTKIQFFFQHIATPENESSIDQDALSNSKTYVIIVIHDIM